MPNQQERTEDRLHWLGGIIDGEGCVTTTAGHTKTGHGNKYQHRRYTPLVHIVNTDQGIIEEVLSILKENNIPCWVSKKTNRQWKKHPTWKAKTEIQIIGMKRCLNACNKLIPYLRSDKKQRMEHMKEWIEYRLTSPKIPFKGKGFGGSKQPYTEKDYKLLGLIRQSPVILRDYTPSPDNKSGEDIVRPTPKGDG